VGPAAYSRRAAFTSLGAVLYAAGAYATSYIVSPWGMGQLRPAVIIPSLFSIIFGPWVGGVSAAIGTLLADSAKHGTLYLPSLVAAVPANLVAFYVFGKLLEGRFNWGRFIAASIIALLLGNSLCAVLYTSYKAAIGAIPGQLVPGLSLGLTLWWFSTMIPFQLLALPPLLRALVKAIPSLAPLDVREECLSSELPKRELVLALASPGAIMLAIGLGVYASQHVAWLFVGALNPGLREIVRMLIATIFSATGSILVAGSLILIKLGGKTGVNAAYPHS